MPDKPNILLVHGAWGDASHWRHVIPLLHKKGYRVLGVQNPLTSLSDDVDRTSKLAAAQEAPTLLVGHAYGCAVIAGAGHTPNVVCAAPKARRDLRPSCRQVAESSPVAISRPYHHTSVPRN